MECSLFYTIYKITNQINGKFYIGMHQTKDLDDGYMGSGKLLKRAIEKYDIENFTKEYLEIFDTEEKMNLAEKILVVVDPEVSYNLCEGGHGGFGYINDNEELRISKNRKARKNADKIIFEKYGVKNPSQLDHVRKQISERNCKLHKEGKMKAPDWTDKKHKPETIEKMKKTKSCGFGIGKNNSQYGTCWITNGKENKKVKKEELDKYIKLGYYKGRVIAGLV